MGISFFTSMREAKTVIIVAGGSGQRMGEEIPKQFLILNKKPVLAHSLEIFKKFDPEIRIILVLPENHIDYWKDLCTQYQCNIKHEIVAGGEARFISVKNGLEIVKDEGLVAIHDGVRPLVNLKTIQNAFETAQSFGAAIPVIAINDSVRELTEKGNQMVDRKKLRLIQTPQVFHASDIKKAYQQIFQNDFTDDASVYETSGEPIYLTEGNWENIKITRPLDLIIAESILKSK
jgi:2-C-methyl-D-erythritol 4-phosphate cytidylyltransferase